ncbi:MAG: hypothetical protein PHU51_01410 [Candidatus Nanoarchaeia archaeon]|nr:hypothetical protein [Candidatus Nanoarchaeia archaeon]
MNRLEFVEFWAKYVREHSDKDWSKQQNVLLNSMNTKISLKDYLKLKK